MQLNKLLSSVLILCLICLQSCERSADWDIKSVDDVQLVVEAILTDELKFQEIYLSTTVQELNAENFGLDDAIVRVETNDLVYVFVADNTIKGRYVSRELFAIQGAMSYQLTINWAGAEYNATSRLSTVAPMPQIGFTRFEGGDSLYLSNTVVPLFSNNQQSMYQFNVDWSHIHQQGLNQASMYYYTFSSVHNSQFIRPDAEIVPFPKGSVVEVIKYGLNNDFAEFLRAQVIETDWNGAILYGNPENAPTNISNGGLGFFTTCAVIKETLIAE